MPATSAASPDASRASSAAVSPASTISRESWPALLAQLLELVLARGGVEEVRGHGGIHLETGEVDAERQERAHGLLHAVAEHRAREQGS